MISSMHIYSMLAASMFQEPVRPRIRRVEEQPESDKSQTQRMLKAIRKRERRAQRNRKLESRGVE